MNFAVVGTSWITDSFLESLFDCGEHRLCAVVSRSREKGEAFGKKYGSGIPVLTPEQAAQCPDIQAVYIASPNAFHYEQAKLFLQNGRHVICEKPLCVLPEQVDELYALADRNHTVLCEAIMGLHFPDVYLVQKALSRLGRIRSATLDFSQYSSKYPAFLRGETPNIFLPEMRAGCLEDLGIYNIYLALILFGVPDSVAASAVFLPTGADACGAALFGYGDKTVTLTYSKTAGSVQPSQIYGDEGCMLLESVSQIGTVRILYRDGREETVCTAKDRRQIMACEAQDFLAYTRGEYRYVPYETARRYSRQTAEIMEKIRRAAGGFAF